MLQAFGTGLAFSHIRFSIQFLDFVINLRVMSKPEINIQAAQTVFAKDFPPENESS